MLIVYILLSGKLVNRKCLIFYIQEKIKYLTLLEFENLFRFTTVDKAIEQKGKNYVTSNIKNCHVANFTLPK